MGSDTSFGPCIYLWRHGETQANVDGRFQGQSSEPLNANGQLQAERAAPILARCKPDALISSDLLRTTQTAAFLEDLVGTVALTSAEVREVDAGKWVGLTQPEIERQYPVEFAQWRSGIDIKRGGGESMSDVAIRARRLLDTTSTSLGASGTAVIVTHSGTIRALIGNVLDLPYSRWGLLDKVANANWSVITLHKGVWELSVHNSNRALDVSSRDMIE